MNAAYIKGLSATSLKNMPISNSILHDQQYINIMYLGLNNKQKRTRRSQSEKNTESYTLEILKSQACMVK